MPIPLNLSLVSSTYSINISILLVAMATTSTTAGKILPQQCSTTFRSEDSAHCIPVVGGEDNTAG